MIPPVVIWTARGAALCWFGRWLVERRRGRAATPDAMTCGLWSAGAALLLLHTVLAFLLVHQGRLDAALADTARRTEEVVGLAWSGGVWLNFLGVGLWLLDAARLWYEWARQQVLAPRLWSGSVQAYLAILMFNATVVFGPRGWIAAALLATAVWWWLGRGRAATGSPQSSPADATFEGRE